MDDFKWHVLVTDDEQTNLKFIKHVLEDEFRLSFATGGQTAIEIAQKLHPDLILLDIMMPDMDGYETCIKLKQFADFKEVPIIFVTAKGEVEDESYGFQVGAVDYITKPVDPSILKARVKTQLDLKEARDQLKQQNQILKENEHLRDEIESITRHDLKAPLNNIINYPSMILDQGGLNDKQTKYLSRITSAGYKMLDMINLSLDLVKMERGEYTFRPGLVSICPMISDVLEDNHSLISFKNLNIIRLLNGQSLSDDDSFFISGDNLLFYSLLSNLIKNALEASPEEKEVVISLEEAEQMRIHVHNQGAIPEQIRETFFDKYVTADKPDGTGLGTYSAKLMTEVQHGTIDFKTSEAYGTRVSLSFPQTLQ